MSAAILINKPDDIIMPQVAQSAKMLKNLKVVTDNINSFSLLEEILYCDFGIAMQITNNRQKGILTEDIIINFDFTKEKIEEYTLPENGVIINIKNKIENLTNFQGRIINAYKISYKKECINGFPNVNDFDKTVLYESLIYRKDTYFNIKKQLQTDEVKII